MEDRKKGKRLVRNQVQAERRWLADLLANEAAVLLLSEIREREGAKEKRVGVEAQKKKKKKTK